MSAPDVITVGILRKARSIIEFAVDLHAKLPNTTATELWLADLGHQIQTAKGVLQGGAGSLQDKLAKQVEHGGRDLWNISLKLKRREGEVSLTEERRRMLTRVKVLGFCMLEIGRECSRRKGDRESELVYLFNLALVLGRTCMKDGDLESARFALQRSAEHMENMKRATETTVESHRSQDAGRMMRLEAEYLAMRTTLSWKEDRLDVAEHMFNKTETLRQSLDTPCAEIMADTLYHVGLGLASKGDQAMAMKWLKRALDIINQQALEALSNQGLELRLSICQGLVRALLELNTPEFVEEAGNIIAFVESELGDKLVVLLWRLELLQKSPAEVFDAEAYSNILRRMIRAFDFSDGTFNFLLHHIKELREKNSRLARALLQELLLSHIVHSRKAEWLDKVLIRRIWMDTMEAETTVDFKSLRDCLEMVHQTTETALKPEVAGAAHLLIWKKVETLVVQKNFQDAEEWCLLALDDLFHRSGELNRGKFQRKLIVCALGMGNTEKARQFFHSMKEDAQNHMLTRYLMFNIALKSWDQELGRQCIEHLSKLENKAQSRDIMYACIREAQQVGDKICTLAALKAVAESWDVSNESASNLPSLFRCTIRLINLIEGQVEGDGGPEGDEDFAEDMCSIFERAALHAQKDPKDEAGHKIFTVAELHWFRKNSYNIGATKCGKWRLNHIIRIFTSCLAFKGCYPVDLPLTDVANIAVIAMRCHFVIGAALVSLARAEDQVDEQLQRYLEVRRHVDAFDVLLNTDVGTQDEQIIRDLVSKLATLFVFDFEAAVRLKNWDDLNQIVRKAALCKDELMFKAMGDCLLRSSAPGKVIFATMRLIINEIFELEHFDYERLAKYLRCIFQAILPLNESSALQLLDQALQIVREGKELNKSLPAAEVEWLVATTFNHAIDHFARGEEEQCHRWAMKAMDLATYAADDGELRGTLQSKFAKLKFSSGSFENKI